MEKFSKYWRPKRHGRNVWLGLGVVFFIFSLLDINHIVDAGIPFVSMQLGVLFVLISLLEDLRYRFYRKFEQAEDEAAGSSGEPSEQL